MGQTKLVRTAFALALTCSTPALTFAQARPTYPIAYISVQKILSDAEDAKAAAKELETMRATRAKDLAAKKQALDATKLQIANAGGMFSATKRAQLTEEAKRQESELVQATQQAQTDFTELQKKVQERLRAELGTIVTALANERKVMYVLNQDSAIVLAPIGANWTDDVLERLNAVAAQRAAAEKASPKNPPSKKP